MQLVVVNSNLLIHVFIYLFIGARVFLYFVRSRGVVVVPAEGVPRGAEIERKKRAARGAVLCGVRCVSQRQHVVLDGAEDLRKLDTHVWRKQAAMDHAQEGCDDRRRNI